MNQARHIAVGDHVSVCGEPIRVVTAVTHTYLGRAKHALPSGGPLRPDLITLTLNDGQVVALTNFRPLAFVSRGTRHAAA